MYSLNSKDIEYLVGTNKVKSVSFSPFDDLVCEFISELSKNLLTNRNYRKYKDIVALSFWCSKSNLNNLRKIFKN